MVPGVSSSARVTDNHSYFWIVPVVFLATIISFYRLSYPLLNDNDVPWHLAIGTLLLQTHHLPKNDVWAYGNQDQPWYILSWLWDLTLGIIQHWFGALGAFIFSLAIGAGLTAGVCYRLLKLNIALPAVLMTTLLVGLCMLDYISARPQLAGYMLAFAFHALLHKSRDNTGYKQLRWLPLLMLLWTNAHGSFMVGFIIMGAYAAEAWFAKKHAWLKRLIVTAAVCLVCAMINPYGPEVVLGALLSFKGSATRYTAEWLPFSFGTSTGLSVWLIMVIVSSNLRGASISVADKILAMGWFIGTMFSIRNGAFFILTAAPYLATCLDEQTRDLRETQPVSPLVVFMNKQPLKRVWLAAVAAFAILCAIAYLLPHDDQIQGADYSIKDAIDYAQDHYPDHHFYTDYSFGGQVIYQTQGKLPFFMDSRAVTAYSDDDMKNYISFLKLSDGWQQILAKRQLNGMIMGKNTAFASSFDKGLYHDRWKLVFEGKRANVYVAK